MLHPAQLFPQCNGANLSQHTRPVWLPVVRFLQWDGCAGSSPSPPSPPPPCPHPTTWRDINALHLEWTEIGFFHWLSLHHASFLRNETLLSIVPRVPLCHILNKAAACLCDMWYISGISWLLLRGKWMATFLNTPLKKKTYNWQFNLSGLSDLTSESFTMWY